MTLPIGIQLYTIRDVLSKDFEGGLKSLADIGYRNVELAGLYGKTPEEAKKVTDGLGLKVVSSHDGIGRLVDDLPGVIHQAKVFGYKYVVVPALPGHERNPAGFRKNLEIMKGAAPKLEAEGLVLGYHNHSFEFETLEDGSRGFEIIFQGSDLVSELDVAWAQRGGDDPLELINKLSGRLPLLHMKDATGEPDWNLTEVGTGVVDTAAICKAAPAAGVEYLIIEQDNNWNGDPINSARISFENLSAVAV